jgi:hypothetical protein
VVGVRPEDIPSPGGGARLGAPRRPAGAAGGDRPGCPRRHPVRGRAPDDPPRRPGPDGPLARGEGMRDEHGRSCA